MTVQHRDAEAQKEIGNVGNLQHRHRDFRSLLCVSVPLCLIFHTFFLISELR